MIIPTYKPIGASSHQLAKEIGKQHGEKATHTGTLDPMAEGMLIVLTGEDRFKKEEFSNWKKEYEFEILVGFETDSHDLLGLVTNQKNNPIKKIELEKSLKTFLGKQTQTAPKFSAQRVAGKSGFDLAKKNQEFKQQKNKIEIFEINILGNEKITSQELLSKIEQKIKKVSGDFRQTEITKNWKSILNKEIDSVFQIWKVRAVTSKRTYIRALVRDLGEKLKVPATTFSIIRTKNGELGTRL